ncbi:STAS domain-containing protein [Pseudobacter ginsenosidimutans]|uniref:Anti-anti-sigma factor n=1 Tax=Pseudobacter ginsenosidimutans TaxID=661488 RepID=A0A4Q7MNT2_9BACT|nr:STAS domain-containing protein [Pseudobacter ginsenosidimutans]QEC45708.1 STAS domain-containing protein [Pseudobacter ginsenosidimutans]RZS69353.1 anti-anti-sigma factor [Pseudobacter ginsenosidimutans]
MKVKIDTKQKFHVIYITEPVLSGNMTAELSESLLPFLQIDVKNVIVNLKDIENLDEAAAETLLKLQQTFYEQQASFVICELQLSVKDQLDQMELLDLLNITPSESEAWDIVQMEEIERELLGGDNEF